ncbi:MAG: type VI secretion system tube protein Hcp [Caldimonas sp.]
MSWSNVFLQLVTVTGPVIGEGLLPLPFTGAIELLDFSWSMNVLKPPKPKGASLASLASLITGGDAKNVRLGALEFTKRFDLASSGIMSALDNHEKVIMATITVLNILQTNRMVHEPGFTLVCTDGYFSEVGVALQQSGNAGEVVEKVTLNFKSIVMTYLKRVGEDNMPTNPFVYKKA